MLIHPEFESGHLEEEEKLGRVMTETPEERKDALSERQWAISKREFWSRVDEGTSAGQRIVNIGCGVDADFLSLAGDRTLVAFDLMWYLLERLRAEHGSELNVAGAVQALPFRSGAFDALCCIDLIHHEPDSLARILSSFYRVLAPGGKLFLEDINAWGLLQAWKSLLPRPLHRFLRDLWHDITGSEHRPAPYEFPTSVFRTLSILEDTGFADIRPLPHSAYPNTGPMGLALYRLLSGSERIRRYSLSH